MDPSSSTAAAASVATTVSRHHFYLRRVMAEVVSNATISSTSDVNVKEAFDPKIFWAVNACVVVALIATVCYCCYGDNMSWLTTMHQRRRDADAQYQATVRAREQQRKEAKILSPEQRRRELLASFRRHKVTMTVEEKDIISDENKDHPSDFVKPDDNQENMEEKNNNDTNSMDMEVSSVTSFNNNGQLRLPTQALVPNCCAICLGDYDVGDQVAWSSNQECPHAFHQECVVDWLIKMQPATPCPCCRQEFTDWAEIRREKKIVWTGDSAFNLQTIRF